MNISVIIVDDEPADRYLARRVIREANVAKNIVEAVSGELFLELVDDAERFARECGAPPPPAMVLLDINMPRLDGFEVLEELRRRYETSGVRPECLVVMMFTSSDNPADRDRAFAFDFVKDYVVKPLDQEQLQRVIARHFAGATAGPPA